MSAAFPERLAENVAVSLIVRLLIGKDGQITSGEVAAVSADEHRQRWLRFRGSAGLLEAVQATLAGTLERHETNDSDTRKDNIQ